MVTRFSPARGENEASLRTGFGVPQLSVAAFTPFLANQAEALAGTDNTKLMTALRTTQAIDGKAIIVPQTYTLAQQAQARRNIGVPYVTPEDFGWEPGDDLGPGLRAAFAYCRDSDSIKTIRLTRDSSDPDGHYSIWSRDPLTDNRCVRLVGPEWQGIKFIGDGKWLTRIKYNHANGITGRSILSIEGWDPYIQGIMFDGREQDRLPEGGGAMVLNGAIGAGDVSFTITNGNTYLPVDGSSNPVAGHIKIDSEWIAYATRVGDVVSGCLRGIRGTTAAAHANGAAVIYQPTTGFHPLGIANFASATLKDFGCMNSPSYLLGIENTGVMTAMKLTMEDFWLENCAKDAMDIKCPVTNGNLYGKITNGTFKGWSHANGWVTTLDPGLDCRWQGMHGSNLTFIFTEYMGSASGLGLRINQLGDFSGAQFSTWDNLQFIGADATLFGTTIPSHVGIADGNASVRAVITNVQVRYLSGSAFSLRGSQLSNFQVLQCAAGVSFEDNGSRVSNGRIEGCTGAAVVATAGTSNSLAVDIECINNGYGFQSTGGGTMTVRDGKASGNSPDAGVTNTDYVLTAGCLVEKTPGAFRTVTASGNVLQEDHTIYVDTTAGDVTMILPTPERCPGREYVFVKTVAANSMIIDAPAPALINGASTLTKTAQWDKVRACCDGEDYFDA